MSKKAREREAKTFVKNEMIEVSFDKTGRVDETKAQLSHAVSNEVSNADINLKEADDAKEEDQGGDEWELDEINDANVSWFILRDFGNKKDTINVCSLIWIQSVTLKHNFRLMYNCQLVIPNSNK